MPDYECYYEGSLHGYENDPTSGTCACKPGWYNKICDKSKLEVTYGFQDLFFEVFLNWQFLVLLASIVKQKVSQLR